MPPSRATTLTPIAPGGANLLSRVDELVQAVNSIVDALTNRTITPITIQGTLVATSLPAGFYTPTFDDTTNITFHAGNARTTYQQVRDVVSVDGYVEIAVTAGALTLTELGVSLPVASEFTNAQDGSGVASIQDGLGGVAGYLISDVANNRMRLLFNATVTGVQVCTFQFAYRVL